MIAAAQLDVKLGEDSKGSGVFRIALCSAN
jgi:hypothetical protein